MMTILYQFLKYRNSSNIFPNGWVEMFHYRTVEVEYNIITVLYHLTEFNIFTPREEVEE